MDGRKIKKEFDGPIDNFILDYFIIPLDHIFYKLKFTPNIITTISLIFGLLSAYYLYNKSYISIICLIIAYILDGSDGYFARKHNMVSKFGDYYDHISDYTKHLAIFYVMWILDSNIFKKQLFINFILILLMIYHLSLQELIYNKKEESGILNLINDYIEFNTDNIYWAKYFSCGTYLVYIALLEYIYIL